MIGEITLNLDDLKRIFVNLILSQKLSWSEIKILMKMITDEIQNLPIKKDY